MRLPPRSKPLFAAIIKSSWIKLNTIPFRHFIFISFFRSLLTFFTFELVTQTSVCDINHCLTCRMLAHTGEKRGRWKGISNVRIEFYLFSSSKSFRHLHYVVQNWLEQILSKVILLIHSPLLQSYELLLKWYSSIFTVFSWGYDIDTCNAMGPTSLNMHGVINTVHKLSGFIGVVQKAVVIFEQNWMTHWPGPHYSILVVLSLVIHVYLARWTSLFVTHWVKIQHASTQFHTFSLCSSVEYSTFWAPNIDANQSTLWRCSSQTEH